MIGVSLSRWTISYFAAALVAFLAAQMSDGGGLWISQHANRRPPRLLVLVHLIALGWLSLLISGALFQFVPVLVARSLYSNSLPLPTLLFLLARPRCPASRFPATRRSNRAGVSLLPGRQRAARRRLRPDYMESGSHALARPPVAAPGTLRRGRVWSASPRQPLRRCLCPRS